ncbi:thioredoxin family protein [Pedobacter ginsengisoli]|uniref:thioredoxin family protein n=1 Tax=Pedobacter ginsengisoli TaxID=363852 RepID=UPI00254CBF3B|nr:thioredoxin family protein [Pedobacter ginsengisoli]
MKRIVLLSFALIYVTICNAQTGINFHSGSWRTLLSKAQMAKKMIFVDVHTDWCVPCKVMDKTVFNAAGAAKFYNNNFVNYRMDAEKGEGIELAKKYGVTAYPTFLFLNSEGYLVDKVVGERRLGEFINTGKNALVMGADPKNLGNLEAAFENGERNPGFLKDYLQRMPKDGLDNSKVLDAYFKEVAETNLRPAEFVRYLASNLTNINSASGMFLLMNYDILDAEQKSDLTNRLYEVIVRQGAGRALKDLHLSECRVLLDFGTKMPGLQPKQIELINRMNLIYGGLIRNTDQIKAAGYALAAPVEKLSLGSIRAEDVRRKNELLRPYLTGEKDSVSFPGFAEERKLLATIYSNEVSEILFTAAKAFGELPATESQARNDAKKWIRRCRELMPASEVFKKLEASFATQ